MKNIYLISLVIITLLIQCQEKKSYDLVISNALIYDGTGSTPFEGDIGIRGEVIQQIGDLNGAKAKRTIDASGMAVSPGFIDLHMHLDPILRLISCESHIRQGVTTALGGPDGGGPWPFKDHLDTIRSLNPGMNVGFLVGHNVIRKNIMGLENRKPTPQELDEMKAQVEKAMQEGAFGISTGLKYLPGTFSEVSEVIALSKVAAKYNGFYTSHLREEGLGLIDAVKEAIVIGEEANIPIVLTHHKVIGKPMWGASVRTLSLVDSARKAGLDIMMDQYPYTASSTGISILIPSWARAGGNTAFNDRINDTVLRDSIKRGIIFNIINDRGGANLKIVQFAKVKWKPELEGKTLFDWCEMEGMDPSIENGAELVIKAHQMGGASCIFHAMDDEDVHRIMQHPQTMIASDGRLVKPGEGQPHPRSYGTYPKVLGYYSREKNILTLEEAILKMTYLPAQRMGLKDRGKIAENMYADIVIFNPEKIIDKATFADPHQYPEGIEFVIVNGQVNVDEGKFKDNRAGKVLMGPGH